MLVNVFSSLQKAGCFIYLPWGKDKTTVADYKLEEAVAKLFIKSRLVTSLNLETKELALKNNQEVMAAITKLGFYLQIIDPDKYHMSEKTTINDK